MTTLLGAVGYHGSRGANDIAADAAPIGVVETISKVGGIPILAHADGPSGAWKLAGNTLATLLDFARLFAMEVSDLHIPGNLSCTVVASSVGRKFSAQTLIARPARPEGISLAHITPGSRWRPHRWKDCAWHCWTAEAFRSGAAMNQPPFDPFVLPKYYIEAIEVEDARYMGQR